MDVLEQGLPSSVETERFVLGSVLLNDQIWASVSAVLTADDFFLEKHRRIFLRMGEIAASSQPIEAVTVVEALERAHQLESVNGIAYIAFLTEGLPRLSSIDAYVKIVKDKSLLRRMIGTAQSVISDCVAGSDPAEEILGRSESAVMSVADAQIRSESSEPREIIEGFPGGIQGFLDPTRRPKGLQTQFIRLDEMTTGLQKGELILVAARPAMGKTAFALNIAQRCCGPNAGATCAFFSLEMSKHQLMTRLLCAGARVDQHRFRNGYLNEDERRRLRQSVAELVLTSIVIDDQADTSVAEIGAKCRRIKSQKGALDLVIVDYIQLMKSGAGSERKNRVEVVSEFSRGLKLLAKDLDVPVIALSQLSRAPETRQGDHRPQLSDLRESGSLEQDADQVWFIFREEVYKPDREDIQGIGEILIRKQRNGPTGRVKLAFLTSSLGLKTWPRTLAKQAVRIRTKSRSDDPQTKAACVQARQLEMSILRCRTQPKIRASEGHD